MLGYIYIRVISVRGLDAGVYALGVGGGGGGGGGVNVLPCSVLQYFVVLREFEVSHFFLVVAAVILQTRKGD